MLQELGKSTIKQEIIVRWLTMSQLLESVLSSYSTLTSIAREKGTIHTLPSIDVSAVATIASLFVPWKHVIERVQASNTPSLHLVVISSQVEKSDIRSYEIHRRSLNMGEILQESGKKS
ncbi:unnamed protein product [Rotaria magnacalcarata]|uniref:Uncharacterized protein n=1 Tax=Rotaria magnacalcarata TaxID=392030 RepID=A0A815ZDC8_9BILA|nr:unnamed protein product [Rotaria magnacalcarata]